MPRRKETNPTKLIDRLNGIARRYYMVREEKEIFSSVCFRGIQQSIGNSDCRLTVRLFQSSISSRLVRDPEESVSNRGSSQIFGELRSPTDSPGQPARLSILRGSLDRRRLQSRARSSRLRVCADAHQCASSEKRLYRAFWDALTFPPCA